MRCKSKCTHHLWNDASEFGISFDLGFDLFCPSLYTSVLIMMYLASESKIMDSFLSHHCLVPPVALILSLHM